MITHFLVPYEHIHGGPYPVRRRLIIDSMTPEIRAQEGYWEEAEIAGDRAIVRVRAPEAVLRRIKANLAVQEIQSLEQVWTTSRAKPILRGGNVAFDSGQVQLNKTLTQLTRDVLDDTQSGELKRTADALMAQADRDGYARLVGMAWPDAVKLLSYVTTLGYGLNRISTGTFPTTGILDNFNRANEGPPLSTSWDEDVLDDGDLRFKVVSNEAVEDVSNRGARSWWKTQYAADQEAYVTIAAIPSPGGEFADVALMVRVKEAGTGGAASTTTDSYFASWINPAAGSDVLDYYRVDNTVFTKLGATETPGDMANGNKFGLEVIGSTITAYKYTGSWSAMSSSRSDATYPNAGYLAMMFGTGSPRLDDFGGGSVVASGGTDTMPLGTSDVVRPVSVVLSIQESG